MHSHILNIKETDCDLPFFGLTSLLFFFLAVNILFYVSLVHGHHLIRMP